MEQVITFAKAIGWILFGAGLLLVAIIYLGSWMWPDIFERYKDMLPRLLVGVVLLIIAELIIGTVPSF